MSFLGALLGYVLFRAVLRVMPKRTASVPVAAAVAAALSVPIAAAGFVLQFALGGTVENLSLTAVLSAMVGVHLLIGLGEAAITFLTVGLVMGSRPDLVYGARGLLRRERSAAVTPAGSVA